jgi:hypothetical protein
MPALRAIHYKTYFYGQRERKITGRNRAAESLDRGLGILPTTDSRLIQENGSLSKIVCSLPGPTEISTIGVAKISSSRLM